MEADDGANDVLPLSADVEEAAAKGERDGETGEDEDREINQRRLEVRRIHAELVAWITDGTGRVPREQPVEPRTVEDRLVRREGVLAAEDEDDQPADEECDERRHERRHDPTGALVQRKTGRNRPGLRLLDRRRCLLAHAAASPVTVPPVIANPQVSSETSGPYSATISPS